MRSAATRSKETASRSVSASSSARASQSCWAGVSSSRFFSGFGLAIRSCPPALPGYTLMAAFHQALKRTTDCLSSPAQAEAALHQVIARSPPRGKHYFVAKRDCVKLFQSMDETLLRDLIRQRLNDGRLPRTLLIELGHGHGIGKTCDGCGSTIAWSERMTVRISADDWRTLRLHEDCFEVWDTEKHTDGRRA